MTCRCNYHDPLPCPWGRTVSGNYRICAKDSCTFEDRRKLGDRSLGCMLSLSELRKHLEEV